MQSDLIPVRVRPGVSLVEAGKRFRGQATKNEDAVWASSLMKEAEKQYPKFVREARALAQEERRQHSDIFWIPRARLKDLKDLVEELDPRLLRDSYPIAVTESQPLSDIPTKRPWLQFHWSRARSALIKDGWLEYQLGKPRRPACGESGGPLEDFIMLKDDKDILAFVRKYGPLVSTSEREPLALWYFLADGARCLLRFSTVLRKGEIPSLEEWNRVYTFRAILESILEKRRVLPNIKIPSISKDPSAALDEAWFLWCDCLNSWLQLGGVRPVVSWDRRKRRPFWSLSGSALTLMALQLGEAGWQTCSACHMFYPRYQPVLPGSENYCPDCGETAAARQRQRRFREKRAKDLQTEMRRLSKLGKIEDALAAGHKLLKTGKATAVDKELMKRLGASESPRPVKRRILVDH